MTALVLALSVGYIGHCDGPDTSRRIFDVNHEAGDNELRVVSELGYVTLSVAHWVTAVDFEVARDKGRSA